MMRKLVAAALLVASGCGVAAESGYYYGRLIASEPLSGLVRETSGLARTVSGIWTINDSGDSAAIYQLDGQTAELKKKLFVDNALNIDWEAMAADSDALYVADCGNNRGQRTRFDIYRVAKADAESTTSGRLVQSSAQRFSFADHQQPASSKKHGYDCEAMVVVEEQLWVFTKDRKDRNSRVYRLDISKNEQQAEPQELLTVNGLITGADYDANTGLLALLGYRGSKKASKGFVWLVPVKAGAANWSMAREVLLDTEGQWEGILWHGSDTLMISTERSSAGEARLAIFKIEKHQ